VLSLSKPVLKNILDRIRINTLIEGLELSKNEFVGFNLKVLLEISEVVKDLQGHMNGMLSSIKQEQLPEYLMPGKTFLGKYKIDQIISYREILGKKLLSKNKTAFH